MSSSELDLALKEDDFLYVKLGNLKPKCDVVKFSPPSEQEKKRAAEIKSIMEFHFGGKSDFGVPRLSFIDSLNTPASVVSGEKSKDRRSEEHTSELQSRGHLVCRLLLVKKK